jgi:hypothetical protein
VRRWRAQLRWRRWSLAGIPILFANSFPKSGTHLLTQVLQGFAELGPAVNSGLPAVVTYQGNTGRERTQAEMLADLARFQPGDIGYGHLHALPGIVELLCEPAFAAFFILRDPRDVVVSHVHYVTDMEPKHIHHRHYNEILHTFDERVRASILGLPDPKQPFPDISARFEPYLGWLERDEVLKIRYEDFIRDRIAVLGRALAHAEQRGFPCCLPPHRALEILNANINPLRSPTFRSGKSGGWQQQFSPDNKALFKEVAGELLVRLGYETSLDW